MYRPNLILITVECWRSDYFGASTPCLVKFGTESAVFTSAQAAAGWTLPSMTALMSSAHASMFGGPLTALATPERQVLAERLLGEGYWTAGFTANSMCGSLHGFHRGFGTFREMTRELSPEQQRLASERRNWHDLAKQGVTPRSLDRFCEGREVTDAGLKWLDTLRAEAPWFLWLHYMDPHWPCLTIDVPLDQDQLFHAWHDRYLYRKKVIPSHGQHDPGDQARSRWAARYEEALRSADVEIGRLIDGLRTRNDWGRTVVAVMGDHGEEFYEHGRWHHSWNQLYREGVNVPLIIRTPDAQPALVNQQVSNIDLAPTLLDYARAPQQPNVRPMMGRSLRPLIEGLDLPAQSVYSEMLAHPNSGAYLLAITDDEWKYVHDMENPERSRLTNLITDPEEKNNQREREPKIFRRFETMRFTHVAQGLVQIMKRQHTSENKFEMDPLVREQMIALGYMEG